MAKAKRVSKTFLRKWVKALRSGKYKQATGSLYDTQLRGYCCLGVACSIALKDGKSLKDMVGKHWTPSVRKLSGYGDLSSDFLPAGRRGELIDMNDSRKMTFGQIADYIEKTYIKKK